MRRRVQCRLVVGRELVLCKLASAALVERRRCSFEVEVAQELDQSVLVLEEQRSLLPTDPVVAEEVAEAVVEEERPSVQQLRHSALLGQEQRPQTDPDCSPASLARR